MIIDIIQVVSAVILIIAILMQNRGAGLGSTFGGGGGDGVYQTRRSAEKFIFNLTIVVAVIFFATAIINILK